MNVRVKPGSTPCGGNLAGCVRRLGTRLVDGDGVRLPVQQSQRLHQDGQCRREHRERREHQPPVGVEVHVAIEVVTLSGQAVHDPHRG